jgi:hypothetical protein
MAAKGSSGNSPKKKSAHVGAGSGRKAFLSKRGGTTFISKRGGTTAVKLKTVHATKLSAAKLAISFESPLAEEVRRAAEVQTDGNVSAWLAEAARAQLRQMHGRALLAELLAETGPIPQEIRDEVRRKWPR